MTGATTHGDSIHSYWGASNDLGVGFSAAHAIATLDTDDEKLLLFNAASNKVIKL